MNPFCNTCGIEMEQGPVHVSENNPEPYPQGTMRRYKCAKCGASLVQEGITESPRPDKE